MHFVKCGVFLELLTYIPIRIPTKVLDCSLLFTDFVLVQESD